MGGGEEKPDCALEADVHELAEADGYLALHLLENNSLIRTSFYLFIYFLISSSCSITDK